MNITELKRFLRLGDTPNPVLRQAAAIAHVRVTQRYKAEQKENPDAYDFRSMEPLGTLSSAITNANLARIYGREAEIFFEQTDVNVRLTSTPILSLFDERIEYGNKEFRDRNGQIQTYRDLWYVSPFNNMRIHRVTPNLLRALVAKGRTQIVEEVGSLTPDEIAQRFQSTLATASNYSFQVSRG